MNPTVGVMGGTGPRARAPGGGPSFPGLAALALLLVGCDSSHQHLGEWNAPASLKTLASAQADFRGNDRDGDGVQEFWRADVASLYTLLPKGSRDPIRLIELSVAAADDRPVASIAPFATRAPKNGTWFRAIRKKGEPPIHATARFAFCAFPSNYPHSGRRTYILDEGNTVFKADLGHGRGIEVFPDEDELRRSWSKLD